MLSSDFLFPRFFVVPLANPSNFSHCNKCFSSRIVSMVVISSLSSLEGGGRGGVDYSEKWEWLVLFVYCIWLVGFYN